MAMRHKADPAFAFPLCRPGRAPETRLRSSRQTLRRHRAGALPRRSAFPRKFQAPTARVRRGAKPDPIIRDTLFDAEPVKDIDFNPVDFSKFKDCVVFVVNVASEDDYADSMYTLMTSLLEKYYDVGFRVLAFPSNWYGQKETRSNEEIKKFVHDNYTDKITLMTKVDLEWNEIFALGIEHFPGEVIWNFHGKFLFNRQGIPVERFDLLTLDADLEARVAREITGTAPTPDEVPDAEEVPDEIDEPSEPAAQGLPINEMLEQEEKEDGDEKEANEEAEAKPSKKAESEGGDTIAEKEVLVEGEAAS